MKLPRITITHATVMIVVMALLTLTDRFLYETYDYGNPNPIIRFFLATLISACAVMLYERRPQ